MFKLELDTKWIKEVQDQTIESVTNRVNESFERIARGIISDAIKETIKLELLKPEYSKRIKEIVKEMLLDAKVKDVLKHFTGRY